MDLNVLKTRLAELLGRDFVIQQISVLQNTPFNIQVIVWFKRNGTNYTSDVKLAQEYITMIPPDDPMGFLAERFSEAIKEQFTDRTKALR